MLYCTLTFLLNTYVNLGILWEDIEVKLVLIDKSKSISMRSLDVRWPTPFGSAREGNEYTPPNKAAL